MTEQTGGHLDGGLFVVTEHGVTLAEGVSHAGVLIDACTCGRLRAIVAFRIMTEPAWFARAVHLPEDVDVERAYRNFDALTSDVLLNGDAVRPDVARALFRGLAITAGRYVISEMEFIAMTPEDEAGYRALHRAKQAGGAGNLHA